MKTTSRFVKIRENEIFESFSPSDFSRLQNVFEELDYPKHHLLFTPGSPSQLIYFIETGRVRISKTSPEGKSLILAILGPADVISDAAWQIREHDSQAECIEDCRLYAINKEVFRKLIKENPEFGISLLQNFANRLKQAQSRIEDLVFRQVPSRVARLILSLAETYGKVTPNGIKVEFPITHQEIADLVGSSRVTVTQILNRMRSSNFINIEGKRVTIHNYNALEEMVNQT